MNVGKVNYFRVFLSGKPMHTSSESYNLKLLYYLNFPSFSWHRMTKGKHRDSMIDKEMKYQTFNDRENYAAKRFSSE